MSHTAVPHIRSQSDSKDIHAAAADLQPRSFAGDSWSGCSSPLFLPVVVHHQVRAPQSVFFCLPFSLLARIAAPSCRGGPMRAPRVVLLAP